MAQDASSAVADPMLRAAEPGDATAIHGLVMELALYERLADQVESTPAMLEEALFGPMPRVYCDLATVGGEAVGLALWFYDFSTFRGRHGLYLEDLFVRPTLRGQGLGRALLQRLAARCLAEGLPRLTWSVLDWNRPAIDFYRAQGAVLMDDWTTCRLDGPALARLGGRGTGR